jgi:sugar phosphate permease
VVLCQILGVASLYLFTRVGASGSLVLSTLFQCAAGFAFFMGVGAIWSLPVNLLPSKVMGSASGLINTGGQIGGILSGIIIGWYIQRNGGDYSRMWDVILCTGIVNAFIAFFGIWEKRRPVAAASPAAT